MNGESVAPVGLIPVELEIEGLYEDYDRRRRKNGSEKIVSSHVHSVGVQSPWFLAKTCQLMQRRGGELKTEVRQLVLISAGKGVELNSLTSCISGLKNPLIPQIVCSEQELTLDINSLAESH
jgi:hypothetical protein